MRIYASCSESQVLTIYLEGEITSNNAPEAEELIMSLYGAHSAVEVILDIRDLRVITSSGLRILLKLLKLQRNLKIVNASMEVNEIFEVTGFSQMVPVSRALRSVDVSRGVVLGRGFQGTVIHLTDDTIVKLFHPGYALSEIEREREYARKAFVMGIPSVIPYDIVQCGDQYGLVFELIDSETLSAHLNRYPEQIPDYAAKYVRVLKELHATHVSPGALAGTRELYRMRIESVRPYLDPEDVDTLLRINDSIPEGDTVVHGDFHPLNIMMQRGELILIDMGDLTRGHPLYELGAMYLLHVNPAGPAITEQFTKMKGSDAQRLWELFLAGYLGTDDPAVLEEARQKISAVALMKMASLGGMIIKDVSREYYDMLMRMVRENLLSKADEVIAALSKGLT